MFGRCGSYLWDPHLFPEQRFPNPPPTRPHILFKYATNRQNVQECTRIILDLNAQFIVFSIQYSIVYSNACAARLAIYFIYQSDFLFFFFFSLTKRALFFSHIVIAIVQVELLGIYCVKNSQHIYQIQTNFFYHKMKPLKYNQYIFSYAVLYSF